MCGGGERGCERGRSRLSLALCLNSTTEEVREPPFGAGCGPAVPPPPHPTTRAAGTLINSLGMGWERAGACLLTSPAAGDERVAPSVDSSGRPMRARALLRRIAAPPAVLPSRPPPRTHPGGWNACQASHWARERGAGWGGSAVPRRRSF